MEIDPFGRFEKSRAGWSIPAGLFLLSVLASSWAIATLSNVDIQHEQAVNQLRIEAEQDLDQKLDQKLPPIEGGDRARD